MLAIYYITIRLNYHFSIFKNMGVAANGLHSLSDIAPRAPLVKIVRNHPCSYDHLTMMYIHSRANIASVAFYLEVAPSQLQPASAFGAYISLHTHH